MYLKGYVEWFWFSEGYRLFGYIVVIICYIDCIGLCVKYICGCIVLSKIIVLVVVVSFGFVVDKDGSGVIVVFVVKGWCKG